MAETFQGDTDFVGHTETNILGWHWDIVDYTEKFLGRYQDFAGDTKTLKNVPEKF